MRHSITIPDEIWEWAQIRCGSNNPASFLRGGLLEWRRTLDNGSADPGTLGSARYSDVCYGCRKDIHQGDDVIFRKFGGRTRVLHPECRGLVKG